MIARQRLGSGCRFCAAQTAVRLPMELNQTELLRIFAAETEENLAAMEEGLLRLEAHPENAAQHVDQVFRAAHTLKGNSSSLGFTAMAALAHDAEHLLDRVRCAEL